MQCGLFPQQQWFVDFTFARCILRYCNIYLPPSLLICSFFITRHTCVIFILAKHGNEKLHTMAYVMR